MLLILGPHGGTAGKHVFAEKPLCCGSASEVAELSDLSRRTHRCPSPLQPMPSAPRLSACSGDEGERDGAAKSLTRQRTAARKIELFAGDAPEEIVALPVPPRPPPLPFLGRLDEESVFDVVYLDDLLRVTRGGRGRGTLRIYERE